MYRLLILSVLIVCCTCIPKTPRIYNVLISTKKNLSPSHALPVYEPVLRTTSLGYAFGPLVYQNPVETAQHNFGSEQVLPQEQGTRNTKVYNLQGNDNPAVQKNHPDLQYAQPAPNVVHASTATTGSATQEKQSPGVEYNQAEQTFDDSSQPLPVEEYISFYHPQSQLTQFASFLPKEAQPQQRELAYENNDPKQIVANYRKNSDIPDVPPPPIPVRTS